LPIITPVHVVLSYTSQLTDDIKSALNMVRSKYGEILPSMIATITGPSRTADIEGSIVYGAHGPKELIVFLIDDLTINDIEEV
jgi:L-lactate dehydrogenase complex protein LldG